MEYGLLTKKKYSLNIDKIQAIKLKQTLLRQLLNLYSIEVIVIGYGDDSGEQAIIYPLANEQLKNKIIAELLPEFKFKGNIIKPKKNVIFIFILMRTLIPLFIFAIAVYIFSIPTKIFLSISLAILIIQIFLGYRNYTNTSLGVTSKSIFTTNGGRLKPHIL